MNVLGYTRNEANVMERLRQPDVRELTCRVTATDYLAKISCRIVKGVPRIKVLNVSMQVELIGISKEDLYTGMMEIPGKDIGRFLAAMDERSVVGLERCLARVYVDGNDTILGLSRYSVR